MKEFLRFMIVKTFFTGFRKFVTMAAVVYAVYNMGVAPDGSQISEFDSFTDEEIAEMEKSIDESRSPSSVDSLNSQTADRTRSSVSKKNNDFFDTSNGTQFDGTPSSLENTVNELVQDIENRADSVDRDRGVSRSRASADSSKSDSGEGDTSASSESSSGPALCTDALDPTCGSTNVVEVAECDPNIEDCSTLNSSSDDDDVTSIVNPPKEISCTPDLSGGNFGAGVAVNIIPTESSAQITYCVGMGDSSFCDVYGSGVDYSSTLSFSADGIYNLSYYCKSNDGYTTEVATETYDIDSTLPALVVSFPKVQTQSTELPVTNSAQSTDFGKPNYKYSQINLKSHDPTSSGLGWTCEDIKAQYNSLATPSPAIIQSEFDTEGLSTSDQIDQSIDSANLEVGDNYIVTLLEDTDRNLLACQIQNVVLEDTFNAAFTGTGSTPVTSGVRKIAGGFVGFGHFQAAPNTSEAGANENQQGFQVNKADLFNIVY